MWAGILLFSPFALMLFVIMRMAQIDYQDHPEERIDYKLLWSKTARIFWIRTKDKNERDK